MGRFENPGDTLLKIVTYVSCLVIRLVGGERRMRQNLDQWACLLALPSYACPTQAQPDHPI